MPEWAGKRSELHPPIHLARLTHGSVLPRTGVAHEPAGQDREEAITFFSLPFHDAYIQYVSRQVYPWRIKIDA